MRAYATADGESNFVVTKTEHENILLRATAGTVTDPVEVILKEKISKMKTESNNLCQLDAVYRRVRELLRNKPPEFNSIPTLNLVQQAFLLGYDVVLANAQTSDD